MSVYDKRVFNIELGLSQQISSPGMTFGEKARQLDQTFSPNVDDQYPDQMRDYGVKLLKINDLCVSGVQIF